MVLDQGKDKLEWYRTVDAAKLEHLKEMMAADNYKENLGTLIRLNHQSFSNCKKKFLKFPQKFKDFPLNQLKLPGSSSNHWRSYNEVICYFQDYLWLCLCDLCWPSKRSNQEQLNEKIGSNHLDGDSASSHCWESQQEDGGRPQQQSWLPFPSWFGFLLRIWRRTLKTNVEWSNFKTGSYIFFACFLLALRCTFQKKC